MFSVLWYVIKSKHVGNSLVNCWQRARHPIRPFRIVILHPSSVGLISHFCFPFSATGSSDTETPPQTGSNRKQKQYSTGKESPGPRLPLLRWFLLLTAAGMTMLVGFVITHDIPYVLDMRKFMNLLERGEVQSVTIHPRHSYAVVKLYTALPEAQDKVTAVRFSPSLVIVLHSVHGRLN